MLFYLPAYCYNLYVDIKRQAFKTTKKETEIKSIYPPSFC